MRLHHAFGVACALAGLAALVATPMALAGGICGSRGVAYQQISYSAPVVSSVATYQAVAPVKAVTTYQTQSYQTVYPVQAVKALVSADYYSSVQDYYQQKLLVDAITGKFSEALRVQEELQALRQRVEGLQAPPLTLPQQAPPAPAPAREYAPREAPPVLPQRALPQQAPPRYEEGPPPQQQQAPPPPPAADNGYHKHEAPPQPQRQQQSHGAVPERLPGIVRTSCTRCHGEENGRRGGGFDLRNLESVDRESRLLAYAAVLSGEMPRAAARLTEQDQAEFLAWFNAARAQQQARR